jgi:hypothetical protein
MIGQEFLVALALVGANTRHRRVLVAYAPEEKALQLLLVGARRLLPVAKLVKIRPHGIEVVAC